MKTKTIGGIAGAVGGLIGFLLVFNGLKLPFTGDSVERQIEKSASDTNKRLPIQLGEVTRWDRVEPGPGKAYSNVYTIKKDLTDQEKQLLKESVTRQALAASDMQATFAAGVTVWYKYFDVSGKKVFEFTVKK